MRVKFDDEIFVMYKELRDVYNSLIFIFLLRVLVFFVNVGSIIGLGMLEDEGDNDQDVDKSED